MLGPTQCSLYRVCLYQVPVESTLPENSMNQRISKTEWVGPHESRVRQLLLGRYASLEVRSRGQMFSRCDILNGDTYLRMQYIPWLSGRYAMRATCVREPRIAAPHGVNNWAMYQITAVSYRLRVNWDLIADDAHEPDIQHLLGTRKGRLAEDHASRRANVLSETCVRWLWFGCAQAAARPVSGCDRV